MEMIKDASHVAAPFREAVMPYAQSGTGRKWNTAQSIELQVSKHQSTSPSVTQ
jgi:hypothetical protein